MYVCMYVCMYVYVDYMGGLYKVEEYYANSGDSNGKSNGNWDLTWDIRGLHNPNSKILGPVTIIIKP